MFPFPSRRNRTRSGARGTREPAFSRRAALVVAGLVVAALLGPFVLQQLAG